ncbi:hypothetical protein DYB35_006656 [Aphanomyces astaci]|uniref:Reverse transcriptase Ty1/copia-type domain-containing protein n=1 Tax=Aphanomyces astaci TaxID=112090 RepID=A0A418DIY8_APHAT|nr:hypothetical protein DYB35_006656 [Aphanomyces astaci]
MRVSGENLEVVCTYVDDFLVMAKTATMANKILDELKTKMKLERQGDAAYFLGEQSKHIDVRHYYARQPMGIGTIEVRHVGTADQLADVLTKVSTKDAIMKCKNAAMDVSPHIRITTRTTRDIIWNGGGPPEQPLYHPPFEEEVQNSPNPFQERKSKRPKPQKSTNLDYT